jgi:hypothetical protein
MAKKQHILRSLVAAMVIFSLSLSFLPDALLDFFHHHEHVHCEGYLPGEYNIEAEHIHCEFPDLYIGFFQHHPPVFTHYPVVFRLLFPVESNTPLIQPAYHTCGRAPPVQA